MTDETETETDKTEKKKKKKKKEEEEEEEEEGEGDSKLEELSSSSCCKETYVSTNRIDIPTSRAGWAEAHVDVLEDVRQGQEVVTVYDSWGGVVEKVKAPAAGRVLQVKTDPAVEGGSIVLVLVNNGTTTI